MMLVALITIVGDKGSVAPGESFELADKDQANYLIERRLAVAVDEPKSEPVKTGAKRQGKGAA